MSSRRERAVKQLERRPLRFGNIFYTIAALVSLGGLAEATYLTVAHFVGGAVVCGGSPDCSSVLGSVYGSVAGIPVAVFGAVAYFTAFSCATLAGFGYAWARRLLAVTVGAMFAATLWLLVVQAFVLHTFCRYCLFSAALVFVLAAQVIVMPTQSRG